jgi:hypothetical protein
VRVCVVDSVWVVFSVSTDIVVDVNVYVVSSVETCVLVTVVVAIA